MDSKQFDELVARLASGQSRREALKGIAGGTLATVGITSVATAKGKKARGEGKKNKAKAEACIPTGKKCPALKPRGRTGKRKPKKLGCNRCCQRRTTTNANGKTICHCAPVGTSCTQTRECCDGTCVGGTCVEYGG